MKFKLPESITDLDLDALNALLQDAVTEYGDLAQVDDADLTDEQIADLEVLAAAVETIQAEATAREAVAAERTDRVAAAKAKIESASAEETTDEVNVEATDEVDAVDVVVPDDASELTEEQAVVASAGSNKSVARRAAARAPRVAAPAAAAPHAKLIAAADVRGFASGQELDGTKEAAIAFGARLAGFPAGRAPGVSLQVGAFTINKLIDPAFALSGRDSEADFEKIMQASKQQSSEGPLVAAGGWCAPSTTVYNIPSLETISGILNLPEVTIERGGLNFTKGPAFEDIFAAVGFTQTEAQAEAGTAKRFTSITCPEFEEVRLDAMGWGLTAPILTSKAYPELIKRFLDGAIVAHAHKMNAAKINKVVAKLGVAINATEFGSAVGDVLTSLEVQAMRLRYKFRLLENAKIEGFAPLWLKSAMRADIAFRGGIDALAVTDAQINAWLSARNISLQFVYDWQDLTATGPAYPATVQVSLYPAGAYVAGTSDVISVDAVYDTAGLKVNEYTAAFFEEGLMVFNPVGNGVLAEIALDYHGRKGAYDITSLVVAP